MEKSARKSRHTVTPLAASEASWRWALSGHATLTALTGTSQRQHLVENIASIEGPPLSNENLRMIDSLFGRVVSVTGEK